MPTRPRRTRRPTETRAELTAARRWIAARSALHAGVAAGQAHTGTWTLISVPHPHYLPKVVANGSLGFVIPAALLDLGDGQAIDPYVDVYDSLTASGCYRRFPIRTAGPT